MFDIFGDILVLTVAIIVSFLTTHNSGSNIFFELMLRVTFY